jgi:hypothetical protein
MAEYLRLFVVIALVRFGCVQCLNLTCTTDANCNQGTCKNSLCRCANGYISYNNTVCSYQQKQQLTAFCLSFLIGSVGADWFYLSCGNGGYIAGGIFKLLSGIIGILAPCCMCGFGFLRSDKAKVGGFLAVLICCAISALMQSCWWLADWIRIIVGTFKDGNGQSLASWNN